jgi:protein-histidine N-methyltransferase
MCLVAAKVLYFGVGGGVSEFIHSVEGSLQEGGQGKGFGKVETVWEKKGGVGRKVMSVEWSP